LFQPSSSETVGAKWPPRASCHRKVFVCTLGWARWARSVTGLSYLSYGLRATTTRAEKICSLETRSGAVRQRKKRKFRIITSVARPAYISALLLPPFGRFLRARRPTGRSSEDANGSAAAVGVGVRVLRQEEAEDGRARG
jgi:hypothetical protein